MMVFTLDQSKGIEFIHSFIHCKKKGHRTFRPVALYLDSSCYSLLCTYYYFSHLSSHPKNSRCQRMLF